MLCMPWYWHRHHKCWLVWHVNSILHLISIHPDSVLFACFCTKSCDSDVYPCRGDHRQPHPDLHSLRKESHSFVKAQCPLAFTNESASLSNVFMSWRHETLRDCGWSPVCPWNTSAVISIPCLMSQLLSSALPVVLPVGFSVTCTFLWPMHSMVTQVINWPSQLYIVRHS